jgi:glycosyltransferase involved in cell wall biosynthesis
VPVSPGLLLMARRLWQENGYEIAHLHFPDPLAHLAASFLPADARIVITWHSDIVRQRHFMGIYQPWLDRIIERADAIIAATPVHFSTSTQLRKVRDHGKFQVIPYGLDYRIFDRTPQLDARVAEIRRRHAGRPLVFSVGRHVYYKGFEYLVRAATMMDAHVLIGGSGPLQARNVDEVHRCGAEDRVTMLGRIADDELAAYYHACDVFCMPSVERSEAFGLVQLEAMACGKPVVCCDLGNGVTFVNRHEETGLVVPPRDPVALASAIQRLVHDPQLSSRLGDAGRRRARADFPVDRMVEQHLSLYTRLSRQSR